MLFWRIIIQNQRVSSVLDVKNPLRLQFLNAVLVYEVLHLWS